ncbi:methyl-CpG-binding domain protein 5 [Brachyhypopomus gauderio]|uniref:methyl-CpG-binding domain protein 5 n=1 Tax=Brachyhypopomus gauderio TaxID=698409 RepID=UPI0040411940
MNGGKESERGEGEGLPAPAQVPIGWQRKVEHAGVVYISPSGSVLSCLDQVKSYLLTDGTCKCGLECPLVLPKVFNFDPGAAVKQRTAEDVKADEDVTKLCIHKRKLIAVATLHKSMELPHPSLTLTAPSGGTSVASIAPPIQRSATPRAIRNKSHDGLTNSALPDCKNPFKMMMVAGQRHYSSDMSGGQQPEHYSGYPRQRLGGSEPGPKSPYRSGPGGMLSPSPGSQVYGDGSASPRTDPLAGPDGFARSNACGFQGTGSPSSLHGNSRTPLSPPGVLIHGSSVAQLSYAMAGRTNTPLSPPVPNKSPIMKKPHCNVNYPPSMDVARAVFHHKTQTPHPVPAMPPSCALQKKQMTSEKDPLGILDPIPSKPIIQNPMTNASPANFQPNAHAQVPMLNVNIPPAIVPLPSNLPLPTVKPGPIGHGGHMQRTQHGVANSISPSPVTSPVHMTGSALGRVEASPQRSRSSSTSSDHGSFAMPSGPQGPCVSMKVPPRSPRSSMGSPRPTMPSSPSAKPDPLHQYKDPNQVLAGMSNAIGGQHNPVFPPAPGSGGPQKAHPGLLGMPLNQILNQHNAASFPASSLLSAAAKAQLANQNKLGGSTGGMGGAGAAAGGVGGGGNGGSGSAGLTCSLGGSGGGGSRVVEGPSALNSMLPPSSAVMMPMSEAQSGRAALRDKLMAQQRDLLRKRKQHPASANHDNMVFGMLKPEAAGPRPPCPPPEQMRKVPRLGGIPPNTSMAQLLQSMSNQGSHMARGGRTLPPGPGQIHLGEGVLPPGVAQQNMQLQQRLHGQADPMHCPGLEPGTQGPQTPFPGMMNQMHATVMGSCGPLGQGGQVPLGHPTMGHPNAHPKQLSHLHHQQQGHPHGHIRPNMSCMVSSNDDASCAQALTDTGDGSALNCTMGNSQMARIMGSTGHVYQQQQLHVALQGVHGVSPYQTQGHPYSEVSFPENNTLNSNSMACLYQDYQGCMPDGAPLSHAQMSSQPGMTSLPAETAMFQESPVELQGQNEVTMAAATRGPGAERLPGGGAEAVDAIYRAVVDAASKGVHVTITTTTVSGVAQTGPVPALSAMTAFTASIGEPLGLPHAVSAVIHGPRGPEGAAPPAARAPPPPPPPSHRPVRTRRSSEQGKNTPDGSDAHDYFRSPGSATPRPQWEEPGHAPWRGEEFLECSTQVRSSPCGDAGERAGLTAAPPLCPAEATPHDTPEPAGDEAGGFRYNHCVRTPVNFKERLEQTVERCAHLNGARGGYSEPLTGDDQSPGSSTSLEGPLLKDYAHFNGHCVPSPSDTKSLSSEEELRHPDSPSTDLLHYRPRGFNVGELVWPIKGFPPWPNKLVGEEHGHNPSMQLSDQAKVEPEKLKTLTQDLEALDRAAKRNRKAGKLNNHLEAAIQEAMSELDKMSGTVHPMSSRDRERQVKLPKPKRRKISR